MSENHSHVIRAKLLNQLCVHLCGKQSKEANVTHLFQVAKDILQKYSAQPPKDELLISEKIRKSLASSCGEEDAQSFVELRHRLERAGILKKRAEILTLLFHLSDLPGKSVTTEFLDMPLSTLPNMDGLALRSKETSWESNWENNNSTVNSARNNTTTSNSTGLRPHSLNYSSPQANWQESKQLNGHGHTHSSLQSPSVRAHSTLPADQQEVSEHVVLQELLYCFQGIEGKVLKLDPVTNGFIIDPKVRMTRPRRRLVEYLAELGWLHNKLIYLRNRVRSQKLGLIAQAFDTVITDELSEFYRILAVMQSQIHQQADKVIDSPMSEGTSRGSAGYQGSPAQATLTLIQLRAYVNQPYERLQWLVAVCEACQDKRGGTLASAVHGYLQHGDPFVRRSVRGLLVSVCKPLYAMLSRWILDGELHDPFNEFFIQINPHIKSDDQLWHEKYKVRESMVPSFIPMAQARKILATGKSINFLRQVCEDHSPINSREALRQALEKSSVEAMFLSDRDGDLQDLMDTAYLEISRRVLDVLNTKYKFMEHMQALRRYLLLGQGDFIRHLMELLEPELRKQATELYSHNMTSILESAVRATNAQFEDVSILHRLDVRLLELSPGDTGWDVFSLEYHVNGPISTVFSSSMLSYLMLFNALWRAKRTEWILSQMWKRLTTSAKMLPRIPELTPVLQQTYLLSSEMIHLVHQLQYYFLFEVIECSWDKLISNVQQADGLDDVIKAHNQFLDRIKAGALVDDSSQDLATQLRTVYDLVVQLQKHEEELHSRVIREVKRRADYERHIEEHGTNNDLELQDKVATKDFVGNFLVSTRISLRVLAQSYQDVVKRFLLLLASHPDMSLQLLSSRLDFNEHYKRHDSRLTAPLTYQHRRQSELVVSSAASLSTSKSSRLDC